MFFARGMDGSFGQYTQYIYSWVLCVEAVAPQPNQPNGLLWKKHGQDHVERIDDTRTEVTYLSNLPRYS